MKKIILDVDTGSDDAVAIMLAALHADIDLLACTTVWGNLDIELTTANTLRVLDHIGHHGVPVYRGSAGPFAPIAHHPRPGTDRSRGKIHAEKLSIPDSMRKHETAPAVDWLVDFLRNTTERVTLVPVGPLSNIASALAADLAIIDAVEEVVIMGGGHAIGNVTPSAEANIWHDPVAADVVFQAGFERLTIMPLDATHQAYVSLSQAEELESTGRPAAKAAASFIRDRIAGYTETQPMDTQATAPVHDALCIAYLVDPTVVELVHCHAAVEVVGSLTYGRTVFDLRGRGLDAPNAHVAMHADAAKFFGFLMDTLGT